MGFDTRILEIFTTGHDRLDRRTLAAGKQRAPRARRSSQQLRRCYGTQFRYPPRYADGPTATYMTHMFAMGCEENGIEHRFTKFNHPWTNGQVERMNRTIKDATVKRYYYDDHAQLERHLADFIAAYNFGHRLKTLKGLTPCEFICKCWASEPHRFRIDPVHHMPRLTT